MNYFSGLVFFKSFYFEKNSSKTTGKVIDYIDAKNTEGHNKFRAVIEFVSRDSNTINFISNKYDSFKDEVGMPVRIKYSTAYPEHAKIDSFISIWGMSIIFFHLALFHC